MASVRVQRFEAEDDQLPPVCMRCGARATLRKNRTFSWYPPWVIVLVIAGLLPFLIVALVLTKRMAVAVPLCEDHKRHWSGRTLLITGGFLALIALGLGVFALSEIIEAGKPKMGAALPAMVRDQQQDFGPFLCLGMSVLFLVWLVLTIILDQVTVIRPTEITARHITLKGVAGAFVQALEEDRRRDGEADEEEELARRQRPDHRLAADPDAPSPRRPPPDAIRGDDS